MKADNFLILGGDNRSLYLGEFLESQKIKVCYYAFNQADCFDSLTAAMNDATVVILPLPFTRDRLTINTPLFDEKVLICDVIALSTPDKLIFGGQLSKSFIEELSEKGVPYCDYLELNELAIYNSVPTAEGVLQVLIENLPITIHGMKCAVLGYGRTGKTLAKTLKALGADVTVFARKQSDFALIQNESLKHKDFHTLSYEQQNFDALINTVPKRVLGEKELSNLNPDCILVEIASAPFGIDFQAAKEKAFTVIKAGSLPGKVAPKSAGEIIGHSILPIIKARGLLT